MSSPHSKVVSSVLCTAMDYGSTNSCTAQREGFFDSLLGQSDMKKNPLVCLTPNHRSKVHSRLRSFLHGLWCHLTTNNNSIFKVSYFSIFDKIYKKLYKKNLMRALFVQEVRTTLKATIQFSNLPSPELLYAVLVLRYDPTTWTDPIGFGGPRIAPPCSFRADTPHNSPPAHL